LKSDKNDISNRRIAIAIVIVSSAICCSFINYHFLRMAPFHLSFWSRRTPYGSWW